MSALPAPSPPIDVIQSADRASAMLHPIRLKVLANLREPNSAAALARQLDLPRQKVNYHLRELESVGLVRHVEDRKRGNCVERLVQATAAHYLISPDVLGELGATPLNVRDRFSWAYLVGVAARAVRDLAVLRRRADGAKKQLATFTLETEIEFESPAALHAFAEELSNEVARLAQKHAATEQKKSRRFTFFLGAYPTITKSEQEAAEETQDAQSKDSQQ
ncbi:MAG: helix-turn-helix domain-containing protein [Planctomycetota bacterium]|nr:helix-turn-helix domain-containing protein [Planctomycetota bacterium]